MTEPGTGTGTSDSLLTVPDFNGDSGTGSGAKFSSGRVVVYL